MTAKTYRHAKPWREVDGSEVFDNLTPRTIAQLQTYPAMRNERNPRAMDGEHVEVQFYQQIRSGRRCSCWADNTNPSGSCEVCYGVGIVGGFVKFGTFAWLLEATTPNVTLNNVDIFSVNDGPEVFALVEGATYGELIVRADLQGHYGPVDHLQAIDFPGDNGEIAFFIRTPAHTNWEPLRGIGYQTCDHQTLTKLTDLFNQPQRFDIKVTFARPSIEADTPMLQKLAIRLLRTPDATTVIKANRPRGTHALALSEIGIVDEWSTERWWLDSLTLANITDLDWFVEIKRDVRWKCTDTDKFAPQDEHLSWDITVRKVQDYEKGILKFPA